MYTKIFSPQIELGIVEAVELRIFDRTRHAVVETSIIPSGESAVVTLSGPKFNNSLIYTYVNKVSGYSSDEMNIFSGGISEALRLIGPSDGEPYRLELLEGADPSEISYIFRNILIKTYRELLLHSTDQKVRKYRAYLKLFNEAVLESSPEIQYYHDLTSILVAYVSRCLARGGSVVGLDESTIDRIIANHCRAINIPVDTAASRPGLLVGKGHLISLTNRAGAAAVYKEAIKTGSEFINNFLTIDALTTYYSSVPNILVPELLAYPSPPKYNESLTNICFSVDPQYFRMYSPIWANVSTSYKKVNFHYLIISETEEEVDKIVSGYHNLLSSMAEVIRTPAPDNTRFYWMRDTDRNKTLYACARFFLARNLLDNHSGDLFVLDIDQVVIGDLEAFLSKAGRRDGDIQLPIVEDFFALLPGRSHLAGYIYMKNSELSRTFSQDLMNYVGHGLTQEFSWMLDQNAIRFAAERTPISHLEMRKDRTFGHYGAQKKALKKQLN